MSVGTNVVLFTKENFFKSLSISIGVMQCQIPSGSVVEAD